jgi:hypothetical protein
MWRSFYRDAPSLFEQGEAFYWSDSPAKSLSSTFFWLRCGPTSSSVPYFYGTEERADQLQRYAAVTLISLKSGHAVSLLFLPNKPKNSAKLAKTRLQPFRSACPELRILAVKGYEKEEKRKVDPPFSHTT